MQFRVRLPAAGSVIALQLAVRVRTFVFFRCFKGTWWVPSPREWYVSVFILDPCACLSFMRLFPGLCDVSFPRRYIIFIICWAAALLRLCCPVRLYLPFGLLGAAGERSKRDTHRCCGRPCGKCFGIVVVWQSESFIAPVWSDCISGFTSSWASVFTEHICQDQLRIENIYIYLVLHYIQLQSSQLHL